MIPIIVGGGHEATYGHFLGHVEAGNRVSVLNWDAHPDVRPLRSGQGHSGSPFRQILDHPAGLCRRYVVAGLCRHSAAPEHLEFIRERKGAYLWGQDLSPHKVRSVLEELEPPIMVSFDLDAVDQSLAPGVSAPAAGGLDSGVWLEAAYQAGCSSAVASFDLVEMNPHFDRDHQTARLAALTIWSFLRGLSQRFSL